MLRKTFFSNFAGMLVFALINLMAMNVLAETLHIPEKVLFAKDSGVSQAVQNECTLDTRLAGFIEDAAKAEFSKIEMYKQKPKNGKVLSLEITDVVGAAGGAWSGSKAVTIKGTLSDNGKKVGSFKARRYSGGGAFGGYKGTCAILGRCIKTLGKDVATWLSSPSDGATLGDL